MPCTARTDNKVLIFVFANWSGKHSWIATFMLPSRLIVILKVTFLNIHLDYHLPMLDKGV